MVERVLEVWGLRCDALDIMLVYRERYLLWRLIREEGPDMPSWYSYQ